MSTGRMQDLSLLPAEQGFNLSDLSFSLFSPPPVAPTPGARGTL